MRLATIEWPCVDGKVRLETLEAVERDILAVLALCDELSISRSAWKEKVVNAGVVDDRGRQHTGEAFKAILGDLTRKGAVLAIGNGYTIPPGGWHRRSTTPNVGIDSGRWRSVSSQACASLPIGVGVAREGGPPLRARLGAAARRRAGSTGLRERPRVRRPRSRDFGGARVRRSLGMDRATR
jgi:hypothetical protein